MTDARTARLIRTITDAHTAVAPLAPVRARAWTWIAIALASVAAATAVLGVRPDLRTAAYRTTFVLQVAVMGAVASLAAVAALRLAVPGADRRSGRRLAIALLALWPGALLLSMLIGGTTVARLAHEPLHAACTQTIAVNALVPALALFVLVRRGATLQPYRAGMLAGIAAAAAGAIAVALACPIGRLPHLLVAHALPTLAIAGLLSAPIAWLMRPRRARRLVLIVALVVLVPPGWARVAAQNAAPAPPPFDVVATTGGYVSSDALLAFLRDAQAGAPPPAAFEGDGPVLVGAAILAGGVLLNFTPCVLPMMPINLAIIGAGRLAHSRRRGWLLGAAYGSAMAVVYGVLGGVIVATAGTFGVLNGSVWFNAAIAALFVVLGLAMFDVVHVDFSRWSSRVRVSEQSRGRIALAFFMGGVAALLAGACVAPVVIQVVALSSRLYAGGSRAALALPLILGAGMGLPWPFAGAGLAALPKPGAWMVRVKQALGVCILLTAVYYGVEAVALARPHGAAPSATADGWHASLDEGLEAARREGKPVFLDVWATWCKNCAAMDATTFRNADVRRAFDGYVRVKFQAEDLERPDISALLDRLESVGLPTYAVLRPVTR